mgnify:CR=1 FL=1
MRKWLWLGLLAALSAVGYLALAQRGSLGQAGPQNPSYPGTTAVSDEEMDEAAEAQADRNLARITPDQAVQAAQQVLQTQATPKTVTLGNENGHPVWEVVIGNEEVKVDAGTGQVLHREPLGQEAQNEEDGKNAEDEAGE